MTKRPTDEQFDIAILWLENNEGEGAEAEACHEMARWLEKELRDRQIRDAARKGGVTAAQLRKRLAEREAQTQ